MMAFLKLGANTESVFKSALLNVAKKKAPKGAFLVLLIIISGL